MADLKDLNSLRVPAILDRLHELQCFVLKKAKELGLPAKSCGKLELVMEELAVNIIHYAYPDSQGELEIRCLLNEKEQQRCFCVKIRDWGTPFNPLGREMPNTNLEVDDRPIGGLGIFLAEQMSDFIQYKRRGNCNILTFCFDIPNTGMN